jgi:gluconokinase
MEARDHFMPASLLRSQLDTLEPLQPDEQGVQIDIAATVDAVVARAEAALDPPQRHTNRSS